MSARRLLSGSLLLLLAACHPKSAGSAASLAENEGAMWDQVARELATLAQPLIQKGGRVLVIRASATCTAADQQARLEADLHKYLGSADCVTVPLPDLKLPPHAPPGVPISPQPLTAAWLAPQVATHHPAVVISLHGEPDAGVGIPLVCHSPGGGTNLAALIRSGAVLGAVASSHKPPAAKNPSWFALRYTVVTRANVDAW